MRNVGFLVGLLLLAAVALPATAQDSLRFGEPILIGSGTLPRWSPNGTQLAYLRQDSLFVVQLPDFRPEMLVAVSVARRYQWVANTGFVWFSRCKRKHDSTTWDVSLIYACNLGGQSELLVADSTTSQDRWPSRIAKLLPSADGTIAYQEVQGSDRRNTKPRILRDSQASGQDSNSHVRRRIAFTRIEQSAFGDIWMSNLDGSSQRQVTFGPGKWLFVALLSPDQRLIATENQRGEIVIMDTTGTLRANAGKGEVADWAPNSELLLFIIPEETEYNVVGADLFVYRLQEHAPIRVTNTRQLIEESPVWSPDGRFITYGTMSTNELYVIPVGGTK